MLKVKTLLHQPEGSSLHLQEHGKFLINMMNNQMLLEPYTKPPFPPFYTDSFATTRHWFYFWQSQAVGTEITQRLVSQRQGAEVQRREEGISGQGRLTCPSPPLICLLQHLPAVSPEVFKSFCNRIFVPKCQTRLGAGRIHCV